MVVKYCNNCEKIQNVNDCEKFELVMQNFCPGHYINSFDQHPYFERCLTFFPFSPNKMVIMILM